MKANEYELNNNERYGSCWDDMDRFATLSPYSDLVCRHECLFAMGIRHCGCRAAFFPKELVVEKYKETMCFTIDQKLCFQNVIEASANESQFPQVMFIFEEKEAIF